MRPMTSGEIRESLGNAGERERKSLSLPPGFPDIDWEQQEVLAWRDRRARGRAYLIRGDGDRPRGVLLHALPPPGLPGRAVMCALCRFTVRFDEVTLFAAPRAGAAGARGDTVGSYLCAELECLSRLRALPVRGPLDPPPEEMVARRIAGFLGRVDGFIRTVLEE